MTDRSYVLDGNEAAARVASLTLSPSRPFVFDRVAIHEHADMVDLGDNFSKQRNFRIEAFAIDAYRDGAWHTLHEGQTIGAAKIVRFPTPLTAEKLRLRITAASAPAGIALITVSDSSSRSPRR